MSPDMSDVARLVDADTPPTVDERVRVAAAAIMARPSSPHHCWYQLYDHEAVEFAKAAVAGLEAEGYALVRLPEPTDDGNTLHNQVWRIDDETGIAAYEDAGTPRVDLEIPTDGYGVCFEADDAERTGLALFAAARASREMAAAHQGEDNTR